MHTNVDFFRTVSLGNSDSRMDFMNVIFGKNLIDKFMDIDSLKFHFLKSLIINLMALKRQEKYFLYEPK
jgi:hypothetical protein